MDYHHLEILSANSMLEILPSIWESMDEPFADASLLPTYLLSGFTKNEVTVSLSGDGGDEIFGGYNRHILSYNYWPKLKYLPNNFQIIEDGDHVICAVSGKTIKLKDLNYWNVDLQEAYYSYKEASEKKEKLK